MKRVVVLADVHAGSTVAPCLPGEVLSDGAIYQPNKYQQYLNECWADMLTQARKWRPDTVVLLGDIIHGGKADRDMQLISPLRSVHCMVAYHLLEPLRKLKATWYYIRGTEWHEGRGADDVKALAEKLDCKRHPVTESPTWRRLYLRMGEQIVDFMHHVGVSNIRQYQATTVLRDAYNHKLELYNKFGTKLPPLGALVRAHNHVGVVVQGDRIWAVRTPGWQLGTAYTDVRGNAIMADIGFVKLWLDNGKLWVEKVTYPLPPPHVEGDQ